jgi:hypothetical protein
MKKNFLSLVIIMTLAHFSTTGFSQEPKPSALPDTPPSYWTVEEQAKGLGVDLEKEFPDTYVTVVYFHRLPSCDHCQSMARNVYSVLKESFGKDVKERKINLKYVNFEAKENLPFCEAFGVKKPTVILFESSPDGVRSRRASRIWELVSDESAFKEYIYKEVDAFVKAGNESTDAQVKK